MDILRRIIYQGTLYSLSLIKTIPPVRINGRVQQKGRYVLGHVQYSNISAWLRDFQVKIAKFLLTLAFQEGREGVKWDWDLATGNGMNKGEWNFFSSAVFAPIF